MECERRNQPRTFGYRELPPLQCLAPYLACVWVRNTNGTDLRTRVVPDGCIDIVWIGEARLSIAGPATLPVFADLPPHDNVVGARFRPGTAPCLLGIPFYEFIEFAGLMNSIPKIVFSRTLTKADWGPAILIRGNVAEEIARMKREPGKDLVLFAGAGIASTFMNLDLIDEYRLMIHPIVLGRGIPLFKDVRKEHNLKLTRTKTFSSGVVLLQYESGRGAAG